MSWGEEKQRPGRNGAMYGWRKIDKLNKSRVPVKFIFRNWSACRKLTLRVSYALIGNLMFHIQAVTYGFLRHEESGNRRHSEDSTKSNFNAPDDRRTVQNWSRSIPHRVNVSRSTLYEGISKDIDQISY